ncbi:elongation factor EF-2, partial [Puccinia sorghi]
KFVKRNVGGKCKGALVHFILEPLCKLYRHVCHYMNVLGSEQGPLKETLADLGVCLKPSAYKLEVRPLLRIILFQFFSPFTGLVDMISSHPKPSSFSGCQVEHTEKLYSARPLVILRTKLFPTHDANEFRSFRSVLIGLANAFINIIMTPPAPHLLQMSSWTEVSSICLLSFLSAPGKCHILTIPNYYFYRRRSRTYPQLPTPSFIGRILRLWLRTVSMDFGIKLRWKVIMKHLFPKSIPGDLLSWAHLSNWFDMRDKAPKLKVGDTVNHEAKIACMTKGKTGKTVSFKGTILLKKTPTFMQPSCRKMTLNKRCQQTQPLISLFLNGKNKLTRTMKMSGKRSLFSTWPPRLNAIPIWSSSNDLANQSASISLSLQVAFCDKCDPSPERQRRKSPSSQDRDVNSIAPAASIAMVRVISGACVNNSIHREPSGQSSYCYVCLTYGLAPRKSKLSLDPPISCSLANNVVELL